MRPPFVARTRASLPSPPSLVPVSSAQAASAVLRRSAPGRRTSVAAAFLDGRSGGQQTETVVAFGWRGHMHSHCQRRSYRSPRRCGVLPDSDGAFGVGPALTVSFRVRRRSARAARAGSRRTLFCLPEGRLSDTRCLPESHNVRGRWTTSGEGKDARAVSPTDSRPAGRAEGLSSARTSDQRRALSEVARSLRSRASGDPKENSSPSPLPARKEIRPHISNPQ